MSSTNEKIKREIDLLLERENVSFFAFSIYTELFGEDRTELRSVVITIGADALTEVERLQAANILIDIGSRIKRQIKGDVCKHCEHTKGEHSYDECMALVNGKKCACHGYEEME